MTLEIGFGLSIAANAYFLWLYFQPKSKLKQSYEAKELLHDLSRGDALIRVSRVDPSDVFLRSPRDL